jgi:hypothetical protein
MIPIKVSTTLRYRSKWGSFSSLRVVVQGAEWLQSHGWLNTSRSIVWKASFIQAVKNDFRIRTPVRPVTGSTGVGEVVHGAALDRKKMRSSHI